MDACQWFVPVDVVGELNLPAYRDRIYRQPVLVEVQCIHPMKELEVDSASPQRLIERRDDHIAHPRGHLPEERTLVAEQDLTRQEDGDSGAERRTVGIAVGIAEHHVVEGAHQGKVDDTGMSTMPDDP